MKLIFKFAGLCFAVHVAAGILMGFLLLIIPEVFAVLIPLTLAVFLLAWVVHAVGTNVKYWHVVLGYTLGGELFWVGVELLNNAPVKVVPVLLIPVSGLVIVGIARIYSSRFPRS